MVSAEQELVAELIRLRRGWGFQARDLRGRIGPRLVQLSGVRFTDGDREVRDKIRLLLTMMIAYLPPELARAARVAFALDRGHQHRQLTLRIESLAGEESWAPRTTRRRMDHAVRLMAQIALQRRSTDPGDGSDEGSKPVKDINLDASSLSAVVRLGGGPRPAQEPGVVVLHVAVPRDRFALLIEFDVAEAT